MPHGSYGPEHYEQCIPFNDISPILPTKSSFLIKGEGVHGAREVEGGMISNSLHVN